MKADWDAEQWRVLRDAKLLEWMLGDKDAVRFLVAVSTVAECWDDLIDEAVVTEQRIHRAFTDALIGLNFNPFFVRHRDMLLPAMIMSINGWLDANDMQRSSDRTQRACAFVLRNLGIELIPLAAMLVGGWEHMRDVSQPVREFFAHETFEQWEAEHDR